MLLSSTGRILSHCRSCVNLGRCTHCGQVKSADNFAVANSRGQRFFFDNGQPRRIAICNACRYADNRERAIAYATRVQKTPTLRAFVTNRLRDWRLKTEKMGAVCDLDFEYLQGLWNAQNGKCFYTGRSISLARGPKQWGSVSLDKINPNIGYVRGNVVWTTRQVNTCKNGLNADEFAEMCKQVVDHYRPSANKSGKRSTA